MNDEKKKMSSFLKKIIKEKVVWNQENLDLTKDALMLNYISYIHELHCGFYIITPLGRKFIKEVEHE